MLIATNVGLHFAAGTMESLLAVALTLRGAAVEVLLCDAALPACMACQVDWFPDQERFLAHGPRRDLCNLCLSCGERTYEPLGLPIVRLSDHYQPGERDLWLRRTATMDEATLSTLVVAGLPVGEHARAGALRFFARGSLDEEPQGLEVLRRYGAAAALSAVAVRRLLMGGGYGRVVLHHGIYVPQGLVAAAARALGVGVATWNPSYRAGTCIFSHDDTYHHTLMDEPTSLWEGLRLSSSQERELQGYLEARKTGGQDQISFVRDTQPQEPRQVLAGAGLDPAVPTVGLLTNVVWDAQLHYPANVFPDMLTWLRETLEWFAERPRLQLLVRVHPAEVHGAMPSRQPVAAEIARWMPRLPSNVAVLGPENPVNTYSAMDACDSVIVYGTKTGVELAAVGIPVVVAGEAWVRGKGFTTDPATRDEYFSVLGGLPFGRRMDEAAVARARRYAYHFFFRRMIPVGALRPGQGFPPFQVDVDELRRLAPGADAGLDAICDGILHGRPFVLDSPARDHEDDR